MGQHISGRGQGTDARDWQMFLAAFVAVVMTTLPSVLLANSNINRVFNEKHPTTISCNSCHVQGNGSPGLPNDLTKDSPYAVRLYQQLGSPTDVGSLSDLAVGAAMDEIRSFFAAEVASVEARNASGTPLQTVNTPDGNLNLPSDTAQLRVVFGLTTRPFFTSSSADGRTLLSHTVSNPGFSPITGVSIAGSGNVYTVTLPDRETRRADRQARAFPYALTFDPVTTFGFTNTDGLDASNSFTVETANFAPQAAPDTFDPALAEVQDSGGAPLPYALNVLTKGRDSDPDHAAAALTVTPADPVLSAAYGTVTDNATNTGYVYTAPATLDATERMVTFSYSAVDEEGGVSAATTVTIIVPAAAPPPPPKMFVATDDLVTLAEGGTLSNADVKADNGNGPDDLDGAALADVNFSVLESVDPATGTLTFRDDGTFDFTALGDFSGDTAFRYRLSDGTSFSEARVTVRITPVNDAPIVAPIDLISVNEEAASFTEDLLRSDKISDPDGDALSVQNATVTITQRPAGTARTIDGAAVTVQGASVTIDPAGFQALDNDEFADVTVSYQVTDGTETLPNSLNITIIGLDNGPGRQAGAYADTLSARYTSTDFGAHFKGQISAPAACLTCHLTIATVDADVDTVDECNQSPPVFTAYGLELCLNRDANTPALTDLLRRMSQAEPNYAPVLAATGTRQVLQSASLGTPIGDPLTSASNGRDVFGFATQLHSYLISTGATTPPATTDPSGQFQIDANGQITVATNSLAAGTYTLTVLPVNDAGQRDNTGTRIFAPGFFSNTPGSESAVTIEVLGDLPTPVDDTANAALNTPVAIDVLANDTGGAADSLSLLTQPANGTATLNSDLSLSYTPGTGFSGTDSFTYTSRNATGTANNSATVTVTVIASGGVTAVDDAVTAVAGRTTTINVLDNDLNASLSGSAATVVTLLSQPPATEGAASITGQSIAFTPAAGFTGSTSFRYRAVNPTSLGNIGSEATVTVSVVGLGGTVISDSVTDPELIRAAQSFEQSCVIVRDSGALDTQSQQFLDVCANLTTAAANSENLTQAMQALRNEEHFAAVDATATVARGLGRIVSRRLTQIRDGAARGFNTSAITFRIGDEVIPNELVENAVGGLLGLRKNVFDNPNWGLFIAGDIAWVERGSGDTNSGYELQANNVMIGYDQILDERSSLGLAFGYSDSSTDFSGGGELKSTGYQLTVYGVQKDFLRRDLTFEGFLSVGRMEFSSDRRINFSNGGSTVDTFANAEFNGTYINAVPKLSYSRVLGDYNDPIGALRTATRLTWSASFDYLWMNLDDYRETGGDGLGLDVQSETYESLILAFGLDASRPVYYGPDTRAEVYGGLEIRGELLDRDRSVSSAFATAGPNAPRFLVNEEGTYGLGAGFEIGTLFSFGTGGQVDLNYGYERAGGNLTTQYLSLGYSTEVVGQDSFSVNVTRDVSTARDSQMSATVDYRFRF